MKKHIIHFGEMLLGIVSLSAGAAMGIIAGLGQTTSTGTCSAIAGALGIKVGTAMILLYGFFLVLQMLILRRNFKVIVFLQLLPVVLQGWILNFFKYDFQPFQELDPVSYPERFAVFAIGMVLISLGFTCVKCSKFVNYPPETFCSMMAERTGIRFGTSKIVLDFVYVGTSLLLCWLCGLDFGIVREGTVIFAVMNGILINLFMPWVERGFRFAERQMKR
ncbi:MAG: hypothetical protein E7246_02525 [Lachnoclostridium sp.]|nr:hypothetical protein [Lachnoclostridium sp.]